MYFIDQNVNCLNAVKWIDNELIDKIVSIPYIHRWQLCHVSLCSLYSIINLKIRKHLYNRTAAQLNLRPSFLCLLEQHLCSSSYHIIRYDIDINSWHLFVHMHQIFFHFLSQLVVTFSWMKSILRGRVRAPSVVIRRDSAVISRVLKNLSWSFCRLRSIIQAKKSFFLQRPGFRCSRMGYKKKNPQKTFVLSQALCCVMRGESIKQMQCLREANWQSRLNQNHYSFQPLEGKQNKDWCRFTADDLARYRSLQGLMFKSEEN